jgi:hypothetical protein
MSPGHKKRLRRIQLRASSELKDALASGVLSARKADSLLYLPESEQEQELAQIRRAKTRMTLRAQLAVTTIRRHLDSGSRDLHKLRRDLHKALAQT